jgi:hypothetical protein
MSTIPETERRQWRRATTPAEVLSECLTDIRDGLWVCGMLSSPNASVHHVAKPMGCAVGLVGINSGNTSIRSGAAGVFAVFDFETAERWNALGQETVLILANALDGVDEWTSDVEAEAVPDAESRIIAYNDEGDDSCNISPEQAREWFERALKLATE